MSSQQFYRASVIVPWWDHTELLQWWAQNLSHLPDAEVIFVDNGSAADGQAALAEFCRHHDIHLIRNAENRGYAAANNQGAEVATGDYLLFLNNDLEILRPPMQHLCDLAGEGIAGPGPLLTETGEVSVEGWALCIKKSTLQAIGGWCEDYGPGYWDDIDLCYRAVLHGYPLRYSSEFQSQNWRSPTQPNLDQTALIRHIGGTTGDDGRLEKQSLNARNRNLFTQKFYPYLRETNLIIFPDWNQSEASLAAECGQVINAIWNHPAQQQLGLVIDSGDMDEETVHLMVYSIVTTILMQVEPDLADEPAISVPTKFNQAYWRPWRQRLHARIPLRHENQAAIAARGADLPIYPLNELCLGG